MTRIDAIKARLAAATEVITFGKSVPVQAVEIDLAERLTQDLRLLLELYQASKRIALAFQGLYEGGVDPKDYTLFRMKAFADLQAILARLDSPVGDEGAE